ncbi:hypothetical protein EON63_24205, partial [archaeon]
MGVCLGLLYVYDCMQSVYMYNRLYDVQPAHLWSDVYMFCVDNDDLVCACVYIKVKYGVTYDIHACYTIYQAIRRQGYFHEIIGDIQKGGYRDLHGGREGGSAHNTSSLFPPSVAAVSPSGSVSLSPARRGRRGSIGQHMSRQYKSSMGG